MRLKKTIVFCFILAVVNINLYAQQCGNCKKTLKVANYDFDVQVPQPELKGEKTPEKTQEWLEWMQLFWVSKYANSKLFELNKNCVRFIQPLTTNAEGKQALVIGITQPMLPASGNVSKYGDYIITGTVIKSGIGYLMHMELQTACSRQRIAYADVPFQASTDPDYIKGIGEQAASKLSPLAEKINEFATKQRESDKTIAYSSWGSESITIVPKKKQLGAGEETEVEITLKDCDGYALGNREIKFTKGSVEGFPINGTTGGTVKPETVTTDAGGKAKVKFKMGDWKNGLIAAHYLFNRPTGCKDAMTGSSPINGLPIKVSVEYEAALQTDFKPDMELGALKLTGGHFSVFTRHHKSVLYFYPSAAFLKEMYQPRGILVAVGEGTDPKSTTIYETEQGQFYYVKLQKEEATEIVIPLGTLYREVTQKADVISNSGKPVPSRPTQIIFSKGDDLEPMYFSIGFEYENEGEESEITMEHYPGSITVNKNETGVTMITNKITDPKSLYKTEYLIEIRRDPGDVTELEKLTGKKISSFKALLDYTGMEHLKVRILSPYD